MKRDKKKSEMKCEREHIEIILEKRKKKPEKQEEGKLPMSCNSYKLSAADFLLYQ